MYKYKSGLTLNYVKKLKDKKDNLVGSWLCKLNLVLTPAKSCDNLQNVNFNVHQTFPQPVWHDYYHPVVAGSVTFRGKAPKPCLAL